MKVIYVAGPFTAPTEQARADNILNAQTVGLWLLMQGAAVIIPHVNTGLPPIFGGLSEELLKDAAIALLSRCDALVTCAGWKSSSGTRAEIGYAEEHKILVFHSFEREKIKRWLDATR